MNISHTLLQYLGTSPVVIFPPASLNNVAVVCRPTALVYFHINAISSFLMVKY